MKNILLVLFLVLATESWAEIARKDYKAIKKETLERWDESDYEDKEYHNGDGCQVVLTKSWDVPFGSKSFDMMIVELDGKEFSFILDSVLKLGRKTFTFTSLNGKDKFMLKRTFTDRYKGVQNQMKMYFSRVGKLTDVNLVYRQGTFGTPTNYYTFVEDESLRETVKCNLEWE